jgi:hypothetical protein
VGLKSFQRSLREAMSHRCGSKIDIMNAVIVSAVH